MVKPEELSDEEQAERKAFARRFLGACIEDAENQIRKGQEQRELAMKAWEETFGEPWPGQ